MPRFEDSYAANDFQPQALGQPAGGAFIEDDQIRRQLFRQLHSRSLARS